jgi:hypothetical protein
MSGIMPPSAVKESCMALTAPHDAAVAKIFALGAALTNVFGRMVGNQCGMPCQTRNSA